MSSILLQNSEPHTLRSGAVEVERSLAQWILRVDAPRRLSRVQFEARFLKIWDVTGVTPDQATSSVESNGQIGNLQLSSQEEADLVIFTLQAECATGDRRERAHTLSIEGLDQPRRPLANSEADRIAF